MWDIYAAGKSPEMIRIANWSLELSG
jgi:hypothetical protein